MAIQVIHSYTFRDDDAVKASAAFYVNYTSALETLVAVTDDWVLLGGLLDLVSGAVIIEGHVKIPLAPDAGWKDTALTGESVSDTLNLSFSNDISTKRDTFIVPALRDTLVVDGRPVLTASGAIDDLVQQIVGGFSNGDFQNDNHQNLVALLAAFQGVRKHRKQLKNNSTVIP